MGGLIAVLVATVIWLSKEDEALTSPIAYVVCGDRSFEESRVYRVDLLAGELKEVSDPIDWLGRPSHLAYDPVHSRLYIASMNNRWLRGMWPVTVLSVGGGEFEVLNRFPTNRENELLDKARAGKRPPDMLIQSAYRIFVSPDGNELYVGHGGLHETKMLTEVWNASTGEVLRQLPTSIPRIHEWSPDGHYVAAIWPSREREVNKDGETTIEKRKGGIRVRSTQTGEKFAPEYLEDNKGLHPPWGRIDEPFIYLSSREWELGKLYAYDRDTGKIISQLEIHQLTGMSLGENAELALLDKGRLIAVSTAKRMEHTESRSGVSGEADIQGYVVLIDVIDRREITRTRVGAGLQEPEFRTPAHECSFPASSGDGERTAPGKRNSTRINVARAMPLLPGPGQFAARGAVHEATVAAVVAEHDALPEAFRKAAAEVEGFVVVHQRASIYAHASLFLDHHFREVTHERAARLFVVMRGHAVFRDPAHRGV